MRHTIAVSVLLAVSAPASAEVISDFDGPFGTFVRGNGTAELVDLTGLGGNLENNAPFPTGALKLTTTDNPDGIDVGRSVGDPLVADIFNADLSVSYSFFKEATSNAFAAPALKLGFLNAAYDAIDGNDGFVQLIYEPTWNIAGSEGSSTAVPTGDWLDVTISTTDGLFWGTGGFGQPNSFGGPPLRTLSEWLAAFDPAFADAALVSVAVGQGTFNSDTIGYVDGLSAAFNGEIAFAADFEAVAVPAPASLALLGVGLAGVVATRRRARAARAARADRR